MLSGFRMDFNTLPNKECGVSILLKSNRVSIQRRIMPQHSQIVNLLIPHFIIKMKSKFLENFKLISDGLIRLLSFIFSLVRKKKLRNIFHIKHP